MERERARWGCDSKRKGLCWGVAFSTMLGYPVRVWLEKVLRQDGTHTHTHTHTHTVYGTCRGTNAKKAARHSQVWSVWVCVRFAYLQLSCCLCCVCLPGAYQALGVWQRQQQQTSSYTNMRAHIILRYRECGSVCRMQQDGRFISTKMTFCSKPSSFQGI